MWRVAVIRLKMPNARPVAEFITVRPALTLLISIMWQNVDWTISISVSYLQYSIGLMHQAFETPFPNSHTIPGVNLSHHQEKTRTVYSITTICSWPFSGGRQ